MKFMLSDCMSENAWDLGVGPGPDETGAHGNIENTQVLEITVQGLEVRSSITHSYAVCRAKGRKLFKRAGVLQTVLI